MILHLWARYAKAQKWRSLRDFSQKTKHIPIRPFILNQDGKERGKVEEEEEILFPISFS